MLSGSTHKTWPNFWLGFVRIAMIEKLRALRLTEPIEFVEVGGAGLLLRIPSEL